MQLKTAFVALSSASIIAAQSPTIDVLLIGADPAPWVASIVDAPKTATTMIVKCHEGTDASDCGAPPNGFTVTQGPSTWEFGYTFTDQQTTYTEIATCMLDPVKDDSKCFFEHLSVVDGQTGTMLSSLWGKYKDGFMPVTITAGANKLAAGATQTGTAAQKTTDANESQSGTAKETGKPDASSTGKNGGAMVTGSPVLVGLAAVGALLV